MGKYIYPISIAIVLILYNQYRYIKEIEKINETISGQIENKFAATNFKEITKLNEQTDELKNLTEKFQKAQLKKINKINNDITTIQCDLQSNIAIFNNTEKGKMKILNTSHGRFFIFLEDIKKHLTGYRITFLIGNPSFATYHNPQITVSWRKSYNAFINGKENPFKPNNSYFDAWIASAKSQTFTLQKDLKCGTWNKAELILIPATEEELGNITFLLNTTDTVYLYTEK